ncbi:Rhodanese-like domain-containing protein [Sphingopyxis sp. YR583]|uniref:rhodanese-like domain-containing protein n=1 Tax=Sphingopyxis sp. YR583 TaxID=1881047 RepID=UPI0008A771D4|nr:rhodanese-like domain-containing protein [Sphingopyxis sp. YR583]SEH10615.1 Rhodanese-like domain-containing protein [Sphingopyxis sp. YR583]
MRTLLLALTLTATPAFAQANPQIDYPGFQALTASVAPERATRLVKFDAFKAEAAKPGTLLLDARSKDAFQRGHIKGAVNLPLTDFTAESLAAVIGANPDRPILIYCNNNFSNHRSPVPLKSAPLALNIQTFINLVGYGYPNVRELADVVDFTDPKVEWVTG